MRLYALAGVMFYFVGSADAQINLSMPSVVKLSAPGGHFDEWKIPLPCRNGQLSTVLTLRHLSFAGPWQASAAVVFQNSDDERGWFGATTRKQLSQNLYSSTRQITASNEVTDKDFISYPAQQSMKIDVIWQEGRKLTAVINGKSMNSFAFEKAAASIGLFVEGAEATFDHTEVSCDLIS